MTCWHLNGDPWKRQGRSLDFQFCPGCSPHYKATRGTLRPRWSPLWREMMEDHPPHRGEHSSWFSPSSLMEHSLAVPGSQQNVPCSQHTVAKEQLVAGRVKWSPPAVGGCLATLRGSVLTWERARNSLQGARRALPVAQPPGQQASDA